MQKKGNIMVFHLCLPFLTVEKGHFPFENSSQIYYFKFGYFSYPFDNSIQYH